jgi:RecG-like helicase
MNNEIVTILITVASVLGVVLSIWTLTRKVQAERKLYTIMRLKREELLLKQLKKINESDLDLTEEEFKRLRERIKMIIGSMPKEDKKEILESLEQKSLKGQVNYVNKILHHSGSTENVSVKME